MSSNRDVLIIGGGSIGLNCAYYLLKSGRQVTLIDSGNIADGSSTGNAGHIVPSHIIPLAAPGVISQTIKWLLRPSTGPFAMKFSLAPDYLGRAQANDSGWSANHRPLRSLPQPYPGNRSCNAWPLLRSGHRPACG